MQEALASDLGKPPVEAFFEPVTVRDELRFTRRHLRRWMRPRPGPLPLWVRPGRWAIRVEPLGSVLILSPWTYPFQLCRHPLVMPWRPAWRIPG